MIVAKAIKPRRFRSEAFTQAITAAAHEAGKEIKKDFEATTKTWNHKPQFVKEVDTKASPVQVLVGTDDEIYRYVDEGTKPHPIFAGIYTGKSNKRALAFPSAFTPKTKPNVIGSSQGSKGGSMVVVPYVQHPGTEPRNFDKVILRKWEPIWKARALRLLRDFARASGHYAG